MNDRTTDTKVVEVKKELPRSIRTNDDGTITVVLHRAVRSLGDTYTELKFREPSARDIIEIGNPMAIAWDSRNNSSVTTNEVAMGRMIARLAVPSLAEGSVEFMKGVDFIRCMTALQSFFFPRDPTLTTESQ